MDEAKDLPPRILLDFRNVSTGKVAAVTNVNHADIQRVRVAYNSREPLITRVVIDLARKIPYTVETVGEDLRVLFNRGRRRPPPRSRRLPRPRRPGRRPCRRRRRRRRRRSLAVAAAVQPAPR